MVQFFVESIQLDLSVWQNNNNKNIIRAKTTSETTTTKERRDIRFSTHQLLVDVFRVYLTKCNFLYYSKWHEKITFPLS